MPACDRNPPMIWTANILGVVENATILWGAIGLVLGAIGGVLGVRTDDLQGEGVG